ncbi:unnamed protein product [Amoebophrya sp. A25]|nr:unnamed protein product [Amoebophrya sp. A25]|eukprot:GSA25T00025755001.1
MSLSSAQRAARRLKQDLDVIVNSLLVIPNVFCLTRHVAAIASRVVCILADHCIVHDRVKLCPTGILGQRRSENSEQAANAQCKKQKKQGKKQKKRKSRRKRRRSYVASLETI